MFTADWFWELDKKLRAAGLDSDAQSFDEIRANLSRRHVCTPDEFAQHAAYVILAGGFSQQTAKKIHAKIMDAICACGADFDTLIALFNNKNKINAICKIWAARDELTRAYYELNDTDARVAYLSRLPHIGKITANHLARNLGEDVVKYDIWIQRLGVAFRGDAARVRGCCVVEGLPGKIDFYGRLLAIIAGHVRLCTLPVIIAAHSPHINQF